MIRIVIAFIIIGIIILLSKHILFNPIVNSSICIAFLIFLAIQFLQFSAVISIFFISFISIAIIDCIRDIVIAKSYYADIEIKIDKLYLIKSLTSIPTFGFARIIFLLVIGPILSHCVSSEIKHKIHSEHPLPHRSRFSKLEAKNYYYAKQIDALVQKGVVISNIKTVNSETELRRKKLDTLYPEKLLAKFVDMVAGDKDMKEKRKEAEEKLNPYTIKKYCAYLSTTVFERYQQLISAVMSEKGCYPISAIKNFEELKTLNLTIPLGTDDSKNNEWCEYFIIQALQPLVSAGAFEDNCLSDKDVFNNHAYHYAKSAVSMPSIDASEDPRFALDDD